MTTARAPKPEEYDSVLQFLDRELRPNQSWSIRAEYPIALAPGNLANIRIIEEEHEYVSHAVLKPTLVKTPIGILKIGAIGSVVTHERFRKQGYSRQVIEECVQLAQQQSCDFAILWTDLYEFYRKFGFELAGTELSFRMEQTLTVAPQPFKFLKTNRVDPTAIYRLYNQHSVNSVRTIDEIRKYLEIPNANVYTAWDSNGQLQAYAVEGKGIDLGGYIHEWGGGVTALLHLLNHIYADQKRALTILVPRHSQNMVRQLTDQDLRAHEGFLGMIKLIEPKGLFAKIVRYARINLGIEHFVLNKTGDEYIVGLTANPYVTQNERELVQLIFGPTTPSQVAGFDAETKAVLEKIFPIPLWMWGWDSV
jgi:GNAT superfamily N-acetyltransferase